MPSGRLRGLRWALGGQGVLRVLCGQTVVLRVEVDDLVSAVFKGLLHNSFTITLSPDSCAWSRSLRAFSCPPLLSRAPARSCASRTEPASTKGRRRSDHSVVSCEGGPLRACMAVVRSGEGRNFMDSASHIGVRASEDAWMAVNIYLPNTSGSACMLCTEGKAGSVGRPLLLSVSLGCHRHTQSLGPVPGPLENKGIRSVPGSF